ncbi:very long chain fatty acid elongase 7-like isoform X2 [Caloenas nicobarica]|uniref:very long chain fatty acid elongase 7-like isoform X2 n=1 Tax=Caloenas nicobarica TaxID=187106 RepID=UPI0032B7A7E2
MQELVMASTWEKTKEFYNWVLESGDPRTDPWLLVHSPLPVMFLFASYLFVLVLGPFYMRQRKPLKLRGLLIAYNLAMMTLSSYMFYEFLVTSVLANYSYLCQPVDYSRSELGMRMARVCWWFFFSKVIELLDTVFFILRKKQEQVTFLHVYHHGTMLFNWWSGVKYVPGGQDQWLCQSPFSPGSGSSALPGPHSFRVCIQTASPFCSTKEKPMKLTQSTRPL